MSLYNVIVKITDDNYGCIYMHADNAEEACERTLALYTKWGMCHFEEVVYYGL